jgi:hypothetical protein
MKTNNFSELGALMKTTGRQHSGAKTEQPASGKIKSKKPLGPRHQEKTKNKGEPVLSPLKKEALKSPRSDALILRRDIEVHCWNVKATISKASKRDDLIPILKRAQENNGTWGRDIACHLLGEEEGREVVGERLLTICESLGLLENQGEKKLSRYFLTDEGKRALESGNVMVPEEGTWTIWASNDPLLTFPILRVEAYSEASSFDEVYGKKKSEAQARNANFKNIPNWLSGACSIIHMPAAVGNELIRLDHIENRIEPIEAKSHLTFDWTPKTKSLGLKGSIDESLVEANPIAPEVSIDDVWREILESEELWSQWDESKKRLVVSFELLDDAELSSMQSRLEFTKPHLEVLGTFASTYQVVEIFPESLKDAQQWAEWKLLNQINTYATEAEFARWCHKTVHPFEEYSDSIVLPTRAEIAGKIWESRNEQQNTSTIWHLKAPEDWGI